MTPSTPLPTLVPATTQTIAPAAAPTVTADAFAALLARALGVPTPTPEASPAAMKSAPALAAAPISATSAIADALDGQAPVVQEAPPAPSPDTSSPTPAQAVSGEAPAQPPLPAPDTPAPTPAQAVSGEAPAQPPLPAPENVAPDSEAPPTQPSPPAAATAEAMRPLTVEPKTVEAPLITSEDFGSAEPSGVAGVQPMIVASAPPTEPLASPPEAKAFAGPAKPVRQEAASQSVANDEPPRTDAPPPPTKRALTLAPQLDQEPQQPQAQAQPLAAPQSQRPQAPEPRKPKLSADGDAVAAGARKSDAEPIAVVASILTKSNDSSPAPGALASTSPQTKADPLGETPPRADEAPSDPAQPKPTQAAATPAGGSERNGAAPQAPEPRMQGPLDLAAASGVDETFGAVLADLSASLDTSAPTSALQHGASAARHPTAAATLAAAIIARGAPAPSGAASFEIRLDPPELGRVQVNLTADRAGAVRVVVSAEQAATLGDLMRSAREIERALTDSGFTLADDAISFDLVGRDGGQGRGGGARDERPEHGRPQARPTGDIAVPRSAVPLSISRAAVGRVDLIA